MDLNKLEGMLRVHEAERLKPYKCSANKLTIGIGRNLDDKGISEAESKFLLDNDMDEVLTDLANLFHPTFYILPEKIQLVLGDMRFNLGSGGIRKFKKMIAAVRENDWNEMIIQMKDSSWFGQVGVRSGNLVAMVNEVITEENLT